MNAVMNTSAESEDPRPESPPRAGMDALGSSSGADVAAPGNR